VKKKHETRDDTKIFLPTSPKRAFLSLQIKFLDYNTERTSRQNM